MIRFESVYKNIRSSYKILWQILSEREDHQNISHKELPTWDDHCEFVRSVPYLLWDLIITEDDQVVGSIYLTKQREIGISILSEYRSRGYAEESIKLLQSVCPGEFYANINPNNKSSIKLFEKLGFKHIQNTYKL